MRCFQLIFFFFFFFCLLLLSVIGHCRCIIAICHAAISVAVALIHAWATSVHQVINKLQYFPIFPCNGAYDCYLIITTYMLTMDARNALEQQICVCVSVSVCMRTYICEVCLYGICGSLSHANYVRALPGSAGSRKWNSNLWQRRMSYICFYIHAYTHTNKCV